jgi:uncharacterized protein (TIGR02145 family)
MKNLLRISEITLLIISTFVFHSCKKENTVTVPEPPTAVTASAGNNQANVTFTAPINNGGSEITGYTVTSDPGGLTANGSASPITVTGLTNATAYTFTVTAKNAIGTSAKSPSSNSVTPNITDPDGNIYTTVTIGTQVWMKENLKTTKYNDDTPIPNVTSNDAWSQVSAGAYCDYSNNSANSTPYGRLYNWYVVDNESATKVASNGGKNVCPTGWHVPTDSEWATLTNYLGGETIAGGKLKETGITHWASQNTGATNESGFTGLPGGFRELNGTYDFLRYGGFYWSSNSFASIYGIYRKLNYVNAEIIRSTNGKRGAISVRCIKD